jgi:hypothetical protein
VPVDLADHDLRQHKLRVATLELLHLLEHAGLEREVVTVENARIERDGVVFHRRPLALAFPTDSDSAASGSLLL